LNKIIKIQFGLVGISNNANARQRFFLCTPELSRISKEFKSKFHLKTDKIREHHDLLPSVVKWEHNIISKIKSAISKHGKTFASVGDKLYNVITHTYIPNEYVSIILNADSTGQKQYEDYVAERKNGDISIWSPVKKNK
jgi:hypothetical protein